MTYIPNPIADLPSGSIPTSALDITDLGRDLLAQETPEDAKTTLEVTDGGGGGSAIVPFTF